MTQQKYTKELMKHFENPKFVKNLKNPDGVGKVGGAACGDIMHLEIKVKDDKISDIGFKTFGCGAAIASSDVVCELASDCSFPVVIDWSLRALCGFASAVAIGAESSADQHFVAGSDGGWGDGDWCGDHGGVVFGCIEPLQ